MYLVIDFSKITNIDGRECWCMSYDKYYTAEVTNVEYVLEKRDVWLSPKFITYLRCVYCPDMNVTEVIKAYVVQWNKELIGNLRWEVGIVRIDILLEVSTMTTHLVLPQEVHL